MKSKIALVGFILTLTIMVEGFCFAGDIYDAKVQNISDREYEQAVINLIDNAKESIVVGMYYITTKVDTNNPVKLLLNDLVEAEQRGVGVRLYINTKLPDMSYDELKAEDEFKVLKDAGCELFFMPPGRRLHDKLVIVDERYLAEGSANWSVSALKNNFESMTLIESPELAKEKIDRLETIYRIQKEKYADRDRSPIYLSSIAKELEIKDSLVKSKKYFPKMLSIHDRRAMDLYLILLAYSQQSGSSSFFLNLEDVGLGLKMLESWDDESLRRQVIRSLRTLQYGYNLIEVEFNHGADARVKILPVKGKTFRIKTAVIDSYNKDIPQRLKCLRLIKALLSKEGKDLDSMPQKEIVRRFHISERTLEKALADLKNKQSLS